MLNAKTIELLETLEDKAERDFIDWFLLGCYRQSGGADAEWFECRTFPDFMTVSTFIETMQNYGINSLLFTEFDGSIAVHLVLLTEHGCKTEFVRVERKDSDGDPYTTPAIRLDLPERGKAKMNKLPETVETYFQSMTDGFLAQMYRSTKTHGLSEFEWSKLPSVADLPILVGVLRELGVPSIVLTGQDTRIYSVMLTLQRLGLTHEITEIEHVYGEGDTALFPAVRFFL